MLRWLIRKINIWVILGALIVAGGMTVLLIVLAYFMPPPAQAQVEPALTLIPGPTPTPTTPLSLATSTSTPPVSVDGISVGVYVKVTGTEGAGLRLRAEPGTDKALNFVGMDEELFQVKDGPQDADGYTWFLLQAPYDPNRSGWAASKYLTVVAAPTQAATTQP